MPFAPDWPTKRSGSSYARMPKTISTPSSRCVPIENEFVKGEWASELVYAILASEFAARP